MIKQIYVVLGTLYLCCEIVCSIVGIGYLFNYILSNLSSDKHSQLIRDSKSDEFFDRIWEDCAKHGPVHLEDYDRFKH